MAWLLLCCLAAQGIRVEKEKVVRVEKRMEVFYDLVDMEGNAMSTHNRK
jgi:hypothetical protein